MKQVGSIKETIERLRQLEAAATPGEWNTDSCGDVYAITVSEPITVRIGTTAFWCEGNPNAQLIAEMRNALPQLLDRLDYLEERVLKLEAIKAATQKLESTLLNVVPDNSATDSESQSFYAAWDEVHTALTELKVSDQSTDKEPNIGGYDE